MISRYDELVQEMLAQHKLDLENLERYRPAFEAVEAAIQLPGIEFGNLERTVGNYPALTVFLSSTQIIKDVAVPLLRALCHERKVRGLNSRFKREVDEYFGSYVSYEFKHPETIIRVCCAFDAAAACRRVQTGTRTVPIYTIVCEKGSPS